MRLEYHPACTLFPAMSKAERDALKEDIQKHGLHDPIEVLDGKIVDGRTRYEICEELGIPAAFNELPSATDPFDYAMSKNFHRRNLSESQKAAVAAKKIKLQKDSQEVSTKRAGRPKGSSGKKTVKQAVQEQAEVMNVSPRSIESAGIVLEKGAPELMESVESGEVSVSAAETLTKLPKEEQKKIVDAGPEAVAEAVREIRSATPVSVGSILGLTLTDVDGWRVSCPVTVIKNQADQIVLMTTEKISLLAPERSEFPWEG